MAALTAGIQRILVHPFQSVVIRTPNRATFIPTITLHKVVPEEVVTILDVVDLTEVGFNVVGEEALDVVHLLLTLLLLPE